MGIGAGDIFLFFGWFRQAENVNGRFRYIPDTPYWHVLFGWLQVERRLPLPADVPSWATNHPHCQRHVPLKRDSLYIARENLDLPGIEGAGGGLFPRFHENLRLTDPDSSRRSLWRLPAWFHPENRPSHLSYHGHPKSWRRQDGFVQLHTVGRGQEFVLDCDHYPEAIDWLQTLFTCNAPLTE